MCVKLSAEPCVFDITGSYVMTSVSHGHLSWFGTSLPLRNNMFIYVGDWSVRPLAENEDIMLPAQGPCLAVMSDRTTYYILDNCVFRSNGPAIVCPDYPHNTLWIDWAGNDYSDLVRETEAILGLRFFETGFEHLPLETQMCIKDQLEALRGNPLLAPDIGSMLV